MTPDATSSRLARTRAELERLKDYLFLAHAVGAAANESDHLADALQEILDLICEHTGWTLGHALVLQDDTGNLRSRKLWCVDADKDNEALRSFRRESEALSFAPGEGVVGSVLVERESIVVTDLTAHPEFSRRDAAAAAGLQQLIAVPILAGESVEGVLEFLTTTPASEVPLDRSETLLVLLANIGATLGRVAEREAAQRQSVELALAESARQHAESRARELECFAEELERKNAELDQFAYVASHDLRAPLRGISNLASWLSKDLEPHLTDDTRRYLELLRGRVQRMEGLITGLLLYSRVGRKPYPHERIDVAELVTEILDLLAPRPEVRIDIGELPTVVGQRIAMTQLFQNLLSNALKYGGGDDPQLQVRAERGSDGVWRFEVADNGPGIAPEYHDKIWGIFQTLQPRDRVEGTGIGLALVRKIVEQQGGRVELHSELGNGARFRFSWPEQALGAGESEASHD